MSRGDAIVIAAVLCVCVVSIICINVFAYTDGADKAVIEIDGKVYAEYRLREIKGTKYVEINNKYGYNKIEICSESVSVVDASCPDRLDVGKKIDKSGEYIVCLPHRLMIRLTGGESGADALAY